MAENVDTHQRKSQSAGVHVFLLVKTEIRGKNHNRFFPSEFEMEVKENGAWGQSPASRIKMEAERGHPSKGENSLWVSTSLRRRFRKSLKTRQNPCLTQVLALIRMSELFPGHSIITADRADFRVYRRNNVK